MKFGFLLYDYFPFGGLQRDCLKTVRQCLARGHEAVIFTRTWQGEKPDDIEVVLFGRHGLSNPSRNRYWQRQLAQTLPQYHLDGLVGFNKLPGLDVYFGADPCFVDKVARLKPIWYRWLPRYRHLAALEKAVFGRGSATQILQYTPREIPVYKRIYGTEDRFHLLPGNATRRSFTEEERSELRRRVRQEHGWQPDENLVIFVGSDFRRKGLDRVLHGLASLPLPLRSQTQLAVLGRCDPGRFAQQARKLGVWDRTHFLGGRMDAPDWMLAADLMVHPAYVETAGAVLVEALASGLPVLTTEACGYAFHIECARAGTVMKAPFQQEEFNQAMKHALTSSSERRGWSINALNYAATTDLYGCHQRAAEVIEETISKKKFGSGDAG